MRELFPLNPFGHLTAPETEAALLEGLRANLHFACEFEPGGGAGLFAAHLAGRLGDGDLLVFNIDLRMATADEHLLKLLARSHIKTFAGDLRKIEGVLKKLIPTATPRIVMDEEPHIDIDYGTEPARLFTNLIDVPEMTGMEENRRTVVIWNGFDRIEEALGREGTNSFVAKAKGHAITSHIMIGPGIERTAQQLGGAMFNQVQLLRGTDLVGGERLAAFILSAFANAEIPLKAESAAAIVHAAGGKLETALLISCAVQRIWGQTPEPMAVAAALDDVLSAAGPAYQQLWEMLNPRQKGVLFGLSHNEEKSLYSEWFIKEHGFKTATNLQAAVRALHGKGMLHKLGKRWVFADPLFALWIRRQPA